MIIFLLMHGIHGIKFGCIYILHEYTSLKKYLEEPTPVLWMGNCVLVIVFSFSLSSPGFVRANVDCIR